MIAYQRWCQPSPRKQAPSPPQPVPHSPWGSVPTPSTGLHCRCQPSPQNKAAQSDTSSTPVRPARRPPPPPNGEMLRDDSSGVYAKDFATSNVVIEGFSTQAIKEKDSPFLWAIMKQAMFTHHLNAYAITQGGNKIPIGFPTAHAMATFKTKALANLRAEL